MSSEPSSAEAAIASRRSPAHVASDVWAYFAQQYPPLQAASVGLSAIASYAVYGQVANQFGIDGHGAAAAVLVAVLFLQYRLIDDISTTLNSELGGGVSIPARPTTLLIALLASLPLEFLLEPRSPARYVAVGALGLMLLGSTGLALARHSPVLRFAARLTFVEIVPVAIFSYVYFAWHGSTGRTLTLPSIAASIGGLIAGFQFWKWSRDLGAEESERIYFISWPRVRRVLVALTMIAIAFNALLYRQAHLSLLYLLYVIIVCVIFALICWPQGQRDERKPPWAGLAFPVLLQIGLYVQLLALAA